MNPRATKGHFFNLPADRTTLAIQYQVTAMAADLFEIGLFKPDAGPNESVMIPRVWGAEAILRSITWLRLQNRNGRNIYVRPKGEHDLSLVDDLTKDALSMMKAAGFNPAVVVETSLNNFQAWLKHPERLSKEVSTAAARALAEKFGGDRAAADWRHFGRLAGFTNRKAKHLDIEAQCLVSAVALIYSTIDALSALTRPLTADDTTRDVFMQWVRDYVHPEATLYCSAEDLYGARCGILHNYAIDSRLRWQGQAKALIYKWRKGPDPDPARTIPLPADAITLYVEDLRRVLGEGVMEFLETVETSTKLKQRVDHHRRELLCYRPWSTVPIRVAA